MYPYLTKIINPITCKGSIVNNTHFTDAEISELIKRFGNIELKLVQSCLNCMGEGWIPIWGYNLKNRCFDCDGDGVVNGT